MIDNKPGESKSMKESAEVQSGDSAEWKTPGI